MPFENNQAAPALSRRSSRLRAAAAEAPVAEAGGTDVRASGSEQVQVPLSRRAARQRLASAEVLVAAAAVALSGPSSKEPGDVEGTDVASEHVPASAQPDAEAVAPLDGPEPSGSTSADREESASGHERREDDAFDAAARAFREAGRVWTAEPEAQPRSAADDEADPQAAAESPMASHSVPRRRGARKFLAVGATVGVMSLAGLLAVSMTLPAEAVAAVNGSAGLVSTSLVAAKGPVPTENGEEIQAFVTSSDAQGESLARAEDFSTVSLVELASEQGIKYSNELFTNDPDAAIQWPFLVGVGMSSGYGPRWGRMHEGIDFVPGEGAPIQAIADGTVRIATEQGGGYGVTVYIDHVIDGQVITSHYSHMQYGSLRVKAGQTVKVGDIVGLTGNTGHSFGAHLHFEIIINGSTIDPLPWLRANAGRYSY